MIVIPNGSILYEVVNRTPTFTLAVNNRGDAEINTIVDQSHICTSWQGKIISASASGGNIRVFDPSAETWSTVITGAPVLTTMREDTSGRLVIANEFGAKRYNADYTVDTTVTFDTSTSGIMSAVAIDPGGDYVYGVRQSTGMPLWRWSIDSGGGAPTLISAARTAHDWGPPGIGVHADGSVLVAFEEVTGTGPPDLSDPYVLRFWLCRYVVGAGAFDISGQLPDIYAGIAPTLTSYAILADIGAGNPEQGFMPTDTYGGTKHVWMLLFYTGSGQNDYYVTGVNIDTGQVDVCHRHINNTTDEIHTTTSIMVFAGSQFPGLSKFLAADLADQRFFLRT